ncbi:hypothetical protein D5F53_13640 [Paenibacillus lautus]|uniref:Uncharacterized protein n=1 Tax=Paenibacillus lautus TaxID=1401 RepID=A0A385TIC9_PAELA|nr:hypothetical protein D5F53_13640 [Paenibacillus lautus]
MKILFKNYLHRVSERKLSSNIVNMVINLWFTIFFLSVGITKGYLNNIVVLIFILLCCLVFMIRATASFYYILKKK